MRLLKGGVLLSEGTPHLPVRQTFPVQRIQLANPGFPVQRPSLEFGHRTTGLEEVAAHMCPAESEHDVPGQPGQFFIGTVAIADDDHLLRRQAGEMRSGYRRTAAGIETKIDHRVGARDP